MNHNYNNNAGFSCPPPYGQPPPFYPPNVPPPNLNRPPPPIGYSTNPIAYQQNPYNLPATPMSYYQTPSQSYYQQQTQQPYAAYPPATSQMVNYPNYMQYYQQPSYQLPQPTIAPSANLAHQTVQNEIKPVPPPDPTAFHSDILSKPPPPPSESQNRNEKPPLPPPPLPPANGQFASGFEPNTQPAISAANVNSSFLNVFTTGEPQKHSAQRFERSHQPTEPAGQSVGNQFTATAGDHMQNAHQDQQIDKLIDDKLDKLLEQNQHQSKQLHQQQPNQQHQQPYHQQFNQHPTDTHNNHHPVTHNNSDAHDSFSNLPNKRQKVAEVHPDPVTNQLQQINELKQASSTLTYNVMNKSKTLFTAADDHWLSLLNPAQKLQIENIKHQQKEFEDIYMKWEEDYNQWKSSNVTVLDFRTYQTNLQEWEDWKSKLLSRKMQLNQKCQETIDDLRRQVLGDAADEPVAEQAFNEQPNQSPISSLESFNEEFPDNQDEQVLEKEPDQPTEGMPLNNATNSQQPTESHFMRRPDLQNAGQQPLFPACQTMIEHEKATTNQEHEELFNQVVQTRISKVHENPAIQRKLLEREEHLQRERERVRQEQEALWREEEKKLRLDDVCDLFTYVNETRDLLDTIDKLDFKVEQEKANYKHQLEYIKTIVESQAHSDSEEELEKGQPSVQPAVDPVLPAISEQANKIDLNSILNKLQKINSAVEQKSAAIISDQRPQVSSSASRSSFPSQLDQFTSHPFGENTLSRSSSFPATDSAFQIPSSSLYSREPYPKDGLYSNEMGSLFQKEAPYREEQLPYRRGRPFDVDRDDRDDRLFRHPDGQYGSRAQLEPPAKRSVDTGFLSQFGIELNASKVLSYKDTSYFLKPPSFTLAAEDLFEPPARDYRPNLICLILRGHPGSGKTNLINLILNEEAKYKLDLPKVCNLVNRIRVFF